MFVNRTKKLKALKTHHGSVSLPWNHLEKHFARKFNKSKNTWHSYSLLQAWRSKNMLKYIYLQWLNLCSVNTTGNFHFILLLSISFLLHMYSSFSILENRVIISYYQCRFVFGLHPVGCYQQKWADLLYNWRKKISHTVTIMFGDYLREQ